MIKWYLVFNILLVIDGEIQEDSFHGEWFQETEQRCEILKLTMLQTLEHDPDTFIQKLVCDPRIYLEIEKVEV